MTSAATQGPPLPEPAPAPTTPSWRRLRPVAAQEAARWLRLWALLGLGMLVWAIAVPRDEWSLALGETSLEPFTRLLLWTAAGCTAGVVLAPRRRGAVTLAALAGILFVGALVVEGPSLVLGRSYPLSRADDWARWNDEPLAASFAARAARLLAALGMAAVAAGAHVAQRIPRGSGVRLALLGGGALATASLAVSLLEIRALDAVAGVAPGALGGLLVGAKSRRGRTVRWLSLLLKFQLGLVVLSVVFQARRTTSPYLLLGAEAILLSLAIAAPWQAWLEKRTPRLDDERVGEVFA